MASLNHLNYSFIIRQGGLSIYDKYINKSGGGGYSLPYTTRYREEYLVDTETNEIIYPKVLPSSITNPPNGDNSEDKPNPILGLKCEYTRNAIYGSYDMYNRNNNPITNDPGIILSEGVWFIHAYMCLVNVRNPATYTDASVAFIMDTNKIKIAINHEIKRLAYNPINSGFIHSSTIEVKEKSIVYLIMRNTGNWGVVNFGSGSFIDYTAIKLK